MRTAEINTITVGERQRKEMKPKELAELKKGILTKGLMHPPVLRQTAEGLCLLAGERRLRAMTELHEEGYVFTYEGMPVPLFTVPYTLATDLSPDDLLEAELEENLLRSNLTWLEESEARKAIHDLRKKQNPGQTLSDTAREISTKLGEAKGASIGHQRQELATAILVAENKHNPRVANARSKREAVAVLLDESETIFKASNSALNLKQQNSAHKLINGDLFLELPKLAANSVDTIICDPPYGINADKMGKGEFHLYDDSPKAALAVCEFVLQEGFRITRPRALLFMFCDFEHFVHLRDYAARMAWTPWRSPITWIKGTDGHAPWGKAGFIRTTETILFASKGQKELCAPGGPDHLLFKRTSRGARTHSAEKPVDLLKHLLSITTLPGETVLDPCCGSGAILAAAQANNVKSVCIEKDESYYTQTLARLA